MAAILIALVKIFILWVELNVMSFTTKCWACQGQCSFLYICCKIQGLQSSSFPSLPLLLCRRVIIHQNLKPGYEMAQKYCTEWLVLLQPPPKALLPSPCAVSKMSNPLSRILLFWGTACKSLQWYPSWCRKSLDICDSPVLHKTLGFYHHF